MNGILNFVFLLAISLGFSRTTAWVWVVLMTVMDIARSWARTEGEILWGFVLSGLVGSMAGAFIGALRSKPKEIASGDRVAGLAAETPSDAPSSAQEDSEYTTESTATRLDHLEQLFRSKRISEEEYSAKRKEILSKL